MLKLRNLLVAATAVLLGPTMFLAACGDDDVNTQPNNTTTTGTGTGTGTGSGGGGQGICLLNNCSDNSHCVGCPDGRDICLQAESRCVACDPATGEGCAPGEECSSFGLCVPAGLTCPTDNNGNPTVTCTANADCLACSPMHQVCDTETGQCQACTATNTQHCLSSDICVDKNNDGHVETCSPKCPQTCTVDNDCGQCGGPGNEAHACFQHKCAECSDTYPCAAGLECDNGVCTPPCGIPGPEAGTCIADEDCQFCGSGDGGDWTCKLAVNGGTHGKCVPPVAGCEDLGQGVAVLPPPYNQYTELCSNDGNCDGISITFNVGEAIRDLVGGPEIDLGFTTIAIQDANVEYLMSKCAAIEITNNISCGICVPCKEDSDCAPINVDSLMSDLFSGEPLAQIAAALLVDLLWGDNDDHNLNFFCQPVAAGYGACIPCGNPLAPCGDSGGGGGSGNCDHPVCDAGTALDPSCGNCAATVCAADDYCCNTEWDSVCVGEADEMCNGICSGGGGCPHDPCTEGDALPNNCSQCVTDACAFDPYCCNTQWDSVCVGYTDSNNPDYIASCGSACGGGCTHSECSAGAALSDTCSACATAVCAADSYCCDTEWDTVCVDEAVAEAACSC